MRKRKLNFVELIQKQCIDQMDNVCQAEIKKHYEDKQRVDELITELQNKLEEVNKRIDALNKKEALFESCIYIELAKRFGEIEKEFSSQRKEHAKLFKDLTERFGLLDQILDEIMLKKLYEEDKIEIQSNFDDLYLSLEKAQSQLRVLIYETSEKLKQDFALMNTHAEHQFSDIESHFDRNEEKLDLLTKHVETAIAEMRVQKKQVFVNEKKIENLYTLIDRLKKASQAKEG